MAFPPHKRLKAFLRRRSAITNSLDLTRSLTIQLSAWLTARLAFSFASAPYFAELREDVLLLYPAAQLVHHASGTLSLNSIQTQSHTTLSSIAQKIPAKHVISFAIEATRFLERNDNLVMVKTKGKRAIRIAFESQQQRNTWMHAISASLNRDKKHLSHFRVIKHVGKGASGRVYKVLDTTTNETLALKVIDKAYVFETQSSYRHAMDERIVLQTVRDHPFVLDMRYAFQNAKRLFLVTEYCGGGDMFEFLNQRPTPLGEEAARFVACEIVLAIEHIHNLGIVYRDLKLENILIDANGHIRLADFGLTKVLRQDNGKLRRTNTFCGTKEYVAPEMIRGDSYDMSLDFWALGILLYEMMSGKTPFYHDDHDRIYDRIEKAPIFFPTDLSPEVRSLISSLLKRRPLERLGTGSMGIEEIKLHAWFQDIDWNEVRAKTIESPLRKGLRFRRESLDDSQLSARAKKRRQEQRKAMAAVEKDVKADKKYVSLLGSSVSIANRPKAPMEKRRGGILAGYCFRSLKPSQSLVPEAPTPPSPSAVVKEVSEESASESKVEATGSGFMSDSTSAAAMMTTTTNADSERDVSDTDPSSQRSQGSQSLTKVENDSNGVPRIPAKTDPQVNPITVKASSASLPPTPVVPSMLSPTTSAKRATSGSSAPPTPRTKSFQLPASNHYPHLQALLKSFSDEKSDSEKKSKQIASASEDSVMNANEATSGSSALTSPRTKSFQLPPSHHYPHLQALLKSLSDDKSDSEKDSTQVGSVSADTVVNSRREGANAGSESIHDEENDHAADVPNEATTTAHEPTENDYVIPTTNGVLHTKEKTETDLNSKNECAEHQLRIRSTENVVDVPHTEESSATFAIPSEDFTEENIQTGNTTDGNSVVNGEDGITSVGVNEIREALGLPASKEIEQSSDESQPAEDLPCENRNIPIVAEKVKSGDETGSKWVAETKQDDSSKHLPRKADTAVNESSSPPSGTNVPNSISENNANEKGFPFQIREPNDSQLCDVSSLVTEMYIPNPFVPSPTSVQDVAGARDVAG